MLRPLEFGVLGPLQVQSNGVQLKLGGRKQRILLGMLVCSANEPVTSERLIEAIWGAAPPPSAEKNLRVYIYHLRRILGSQKRIAWREAGYALTIGPAELDLHRFEDLAAAGTRALTENSLAKGAELFRGALKLWRGPALVGLLDIEHLRARAVRLEEHRLDVLERKIAIELTLGKHADLVGECRALATEYPLREKLQGQLMKALYGSGRRAEALEVYLAVRHTLIEELGVEPGAELQHLHRQMLLDSDLVGHQDSAPAWVVDPDKVVLRQIREWLDVIMQLLDRVDPPRDEV